MAALANRYPQLDAGRLEKLLAQAMFVADLWGADSAG
jgi:phage gp29-like protein